MSRKRLSQDVYWRTFRYTSLQNDLLRDFFSQKEINYNKLFLRLILASSEFRNFERKIEDEIDLMNSAMFDSF